MAGRPDKAAANFLSLAPPPAIFTLFLTLFLTLSTLPPSLGRTSSLLGSHLSFLRLPSTSPRQRQHSLHLPSTLPRQQQQHSERELSESVDSIAQDLADQEASRKVPGNSAKATAATTVVSNKSNSTVGFKLQRSGKGVITGTVRIYLIYYGDWNGKKSDVIENFIHSLSSKRKTPKGVVRNTPKDWWRVVRGYTNNKGKRVGKVVFGGRAFDKYSFGIDLTDMVGNVVYRSLEKKKLPVDHKGIYVVLTSEDVVETPEVGFCQGTVPTSSTINPVGYCSWHYWFQEKRFGDISYAFVGNPNHCVHRCGQLQGMKKTPNGNVGIDAMVNNMAVQIAKAATNFDMESGWHDGGLKENADFCDRSFGGATVSEDGKYKYNMVGQGGMRFLVQQMWDVKRSTCTMFAK